MDASEVERKEQLEKGIELMLDFAKLARASGLGNEVISLMLERDMLVIPVVVQNASTLQVLVQAYTNRLALQETMKSGVLTLWSTSRNKLWVKGAESGNTFKVLEVWVNCEQNSLLYLVEPQKGGMCHVLDLDEKAFVSCFYRQSVPAPGSAGDGKFALEFLKEKT